MSKIKSTRRKEYAFISHYLCLLALPMVIGLVGIVVQFQLTYRSAVEQKLSALNHAIAISETETLNNIEQLVGLFAVSDNLKRLDLSSDRRDYYRKLWNEQTHLNPLISSIFFADSNGQWFSNNSELDRLFFSENNQDRKLDLLKRPWFEKALISPGNPIWSSPYDDAYTQKKIMTVSYALMDPRLSELQRVLGVDLNLYEWSKKISTLVESNNAVRHLLIDRASGQILLHSNPSHIGDELNQPWRSLLVGQSGTFFTQEAGEDGGYVAYDALSNNPNWISITVQHRRDTFIQQQLVLILVILVFSGSLFVFLAVTFRQRLAGIIDSLILMVRQLRLNPDKGLIELPSIPGVADLNVEMNLVSNHLQENIRRASRDGLTGLYNRHFLNETLTRLQGLQNHFVLAMVDLDNFKTINDTFGHALGDTVLRRVAALGLELLKDRATLYRYGGEEMVVIFERDTLEEAEELLELWRTEISRARWREEGLTVTFSAGIGSNDGQTTEALIDAVDKALYRAKRDGRNRIYRAL